MFSKRRGTKHTAKYASPQAVAEAKLCRIRRMKVVRFMFLVSILSGFYASTTNLRRIENKKSTSNTRDRPLSNSVAKQENNSTNINIRIGRNSESFQSINHDHNITEACREDASDIVLKKWKESRRVVCSTSDDSEGRIRNSKEIFIEEFVLNSWEHQPTVRRYKNVEVLSWGRDLLPTGCPEKTVIQKSALVKPDWARPIDTEKYGNDDDVMEIETTVLRVRTYSTYNAFQRFHPYLNTAMIIRMFDIQNPQLVLIVKSEKTRGDMEMWRSFSNLEPIIAIERNQDSDSKDQKRMRFHDLIEASNSATSILVTKSESQTFMGRQKDHHCKSSLFRDIIEWMAFKQNVTVERQQRKDIIQITWSSRQPYNTSSKDQKTYTPVRSMENEEGLIRMVEDALGKDYNITLVNFGKVTTRESIKIAVQSDIIVGTHGAGLVWASFLPSHGGLVEIFGGNRGRNWRHYHNLASLADVHYREMSMSRKSGSSLSWDKHDANTLIKAISSLHPKYMDMEPT